jgi:hypothetical protein
VKGKNYERGRKKEEKETNNNYGRKEKHPSLSCYNFVLVISVLVYQLVAL